MNRYEQMDFLIKQVKDLGYGMGELMVWYETNCQCDYYKKEISEEIKKQIFEESLETYYDTSDYAIEEIVRDKIKEYMESEEV